MMSEFAQPVNHEVPHLKLGSMIDADRFSDSIHSDEEEEAIPQPIIEDNLTAKDRKKLKKKEAENERKAQRQREKEEKKVRKQSKPIIDIQPVDKSRARIIMLDSTDEYISLHKDDTGKVLYTHVCDFMRLEEKDYFGLTFIDQDKNKCWLDNDKRVHSQLKGASPIFFFQVKFYPPEPGLLQEDLTRYQLCLQLRQDILSGKLPCSFVTYALLGSYTAQAELGDYSELDHGTSVDYLKELQFAPVQDDELLKRIQEQHKRYKGQPPNVADLNFLENAKKLAMYGVDIHPAQDCENVNINIGVSSNGILIYREKLRINRFAWPKILKISYKRKYFYIKLRPSDFDRYESTIGFKLPTYRAAKSLWKVAVEHHAFFRLRRPEELRKRPILPRFNSTFRYTGTYTYHQTRQLLLDRPNPDFERSLSKRMTKSFDASIAETHQTTLPRPQSVEPFFQTHQITIPEKDEEEPTPTPDYAHVKKKSTTPQPSTLPEAPPKRPPPSSVTYANVPPEPPARPSVVVPRVPSPTMNADEALLAAIRLATDLDPNKQAEQVVMAKN